VLNPAGKSLGVAIMDYDNDQWEDIVVANDTQPNFLYRNNHDGTFSDVGREVGVAFSEAGVARGAMGIDAGDYDHSGHESLVIGNFSNEMIGLYHNEGFGLFIDDAAPSGVGGPSLLTLAFGTFFFDHDLDGHLDIFVANGHVEDDINRVQKEVTYAQKPLLFRGVGDGTFEEVLPAGEADPLARPVVARGAAYLDHDADGDGFCHVTAFCAATAGSSSGRRGIAGGVPSGSANTKRAPPAGSFSAQILPRCASTMARLMVRPRPTPGVADSRAPRVNFSKIVSSLPGARPGPLSATLTCISAPCAFASMRISL